MLCFQCGQWVNEAGLDCPWLCARCCDAEARRLNAERRNGATLHALMGEHVDIWKLLWGRSLE